jgi:SpoVK/Ycf46/Vps4 family AAA+-type ATPase
MYRIDLSQVVNKYVGETEKNLKRLFDAADIADAILFFDEADAIFGKRMEVRDAHDRYANLEVSYLLARMERFKGLAILATNRRRDLDDAFLRRLRAVVELPVPEGAQRSQIWRMAVPPGVDATALDFEFLGRQFDLTGGHIRSAMLNACLQSAAAQGGAEKPKLAMEPVVAAIKRELDKLNRASTPAQFGRYAGIATDLDHG